VGCTADTRTNMNMVSTIVEATLAQYGMILRACAVLGNVSGVEWSVAVSI
jgi:hypothetical protein